MKRYKSILAIILSMLLVLSGCGTANIQSSNEQPIQESSTQNIQTDYENTENKQSAPVKETPTPKVTPQKFDISSVPKYSGNPYVAINNNVPFFTEADLTTEPFEIFSNLDNLGRCGVAYANVCTELMPTEDRGSIGMVKPSGWHSVIYENVDGLYLYNRCHLLGFQLTGENANERNLITGTRYMNIIGMLPFENMVADYVKEANNHVLLRVTPIFEGNNLLASGVLMEALSMEDNGDGICFNVFCYNVQPGIIIDYSDGSNKAADGSAPYGSSAAVANKQNNTTQNATTTTDASYIGNKNTKKFHHSCCSSVKQMKDKNKVPLNSREQALNLGYEPCGNCSP